MDLKEQEKEFKGKGKPAKAAKRAKDRKFPRGEDVRTNKVRAGLSHNFVEKGKNNIKWRTQDTTMAALVANLPFGNPLGLPQHLQYDIDRSSNYHDFVLPGVMTVRTQLTLGSINSAGYNAAINLASRKMYSFIRHANSGSKNYDAVDLALYLGAVGQALGLLGWIQRAYRIVNEYSTTNRYTPTRLLRAMGLDPDDFIANQAQFKYLIAWFGRAIGALAFPDIPYMHACYEAYKWIIRDSDSPKEQFYMIDSYGFAKYNPTYTSTGGGLDYTTTNPWSNPTAAGGSPVFLNFAQLYAYVHEIMDVLLSDEDIGIISGDILKAYREGGLFTIKAFDDYDVFIKDDELLQQIHNCHPVKKYVLAGYNQNPGGTGTAPFLEIAGSSGTGTAAHDCVNLGKYLLIDAFSKVPTPEEVVNCTVLNPVFTITGVSTNTYGIKDISFDLHLPKQVLVMNDLTSSAASDVSEFIKRWGDITIAAATVATISSFDWHPFITNVGSYGQGTPDYRYSLIGDKQNLRFFDYDVALRIHENSMLSLLNFQNNNFQ